MWASAPAVISEAPVPQADVHVSACVREGVCDRRNGGERDREGRRDTEGGDPKDEETQVEGILNPKANLGQ